MRPLTLCAAGFVLVASQPAVAAGIGPEIAYVKAGTYSEIYLVEHDGTRLTRLYRSPSRKRIFALDMKPGGGELAFEEVDCCSSANATLKVLRYDDLGRVSSTKNIAVCRILSLDYHPTRSELLYNDSCERAQRLDTVTWSKTGAGLGRAVNKLGWYGPDDYVFNVSTAQASDIYVASVATPTVSTRVGSARLASMMDLSTSRTKLLIDPVDFGELSLFDMTSGVEQIRWQIGHYGHFSPDDQRVLYATGYDVRGQYLMIRRTDGAGLPFRLAGKAAFGPVDWRN